MKQAYYILFILIAGLSSCDPKPIDLEIQMEKPRIIISPLFNSENEIGILVTRSFSSLASVQNPFDLVYGSRINSARVSIENDGRAYNLAGVSPVYLSGDIGFRPYSEYRVIVIDTLTGEKAEASTVMLPQVKPHAIDLQRSDKAADTAVTLTLDIQDDASVKRYYLVTFNLNEEVRGKSGQKPLSGKSLYDVIEIFDNSAAANGHLTYEKTYRQNIVGFGGNDSVIVEVSEVSGEYYNYLSIYKKSGSVINQLTGEPINMPSNVRGGAGFFFLTYPVYKEFILGEH